MVSDLESLDLLRSYILQLTDKDIYELDEISLSSAQKSRIDAWCETNGIKTPPLNEKCFWKNGVTSKDISISDHSVKQKKYSNLDIGIDIQKISEFLPDIDVISKNDDELLKIFTKKELSYSESRQNPKATLTGIFAAKEAVFKCSSSVAKDNWTEIEINYRNKSPYFEGFELSISHSGDLAIACAARINLELLNNSENRLLNLDEELEINASKKTFKEFLSKSFNILGLLGGISFIFFYILSLSS